MCFTITLLLLKGAKEFRIRCTGSLCDAMLNLSDQQNFSKQSLDLECVMTERLILMNNVSWNFADKYMLLLGSF